MSYEKRADYSETYLLPPSLEDWVGADHPARFVREVVDVLDLRELGFKQRKSEDGRPSYAADLLLKVWLYGYLMRIRSSRAMERACRDSVGVIWLTGMLEPDHNTLWRFFRENKGPLRKLFKQVVRVAAKSGLIGVVLHAVDGTPMTGRSSRRTAWHKADLEKALKRLDESIEQMMRGVEAAQESESGEYRIPEELAEKEQLRNKIKEALIELEEAGEKDLHPHDKDARMMNCNGKGSRKEFGYNAQAVVDSDNGLVVAQDVVNEADDHGLLVPMIEKTQKTLGQAAEETVADQGYRSAEELFLAEKHNYNVIVALGRQGEDVKGVGEYHPSKFRYDAEKDQCICPRGEILGFVGESTSGKDKYPVRLYRCRSYKQCPVRWECSQAKTGRRIELSVYYESLVRQRQKQRNKEKQAALKRRQVIVEPLFAHIKHAMGFRRLTYRGLESVRTQWSLLCTTVNLSKLYKHWLDGNFSLAGPEMSGKSLACT
jgi:transposase